jgi:hypothetical protein
MNDLFIVTLPLDSSAKYYPNNTVARFVTKLPETIGSRDSTKWHWSKSFIRTIGTTSATKTRTITGSRPPTKTRCKTGRLLRRRECIGWGAKIRARHWRQILVQQGERSTLVKFSFDRFAYDEDVRRSTEFYEIRGLPDCQKSFGAVGERDFDANRGLNLMYLYCDVATP